MFAKFIFASLLVFSLVFNSISQISASLYADEKRTVEQQIELLSIPEPADQPEAVVEFGPTVQQEEILDAATRNFLSQLTGTRREVAEIVIKTVSKSGAKIVGVGSWISGAKYNDPLSGGTSDHDLRLVMGDVDKAQAVGKWRAIRDEIASQVRAKFPGNSQTVLNSINLYPPEVVLEGIDDPAEALAEMKRLNVNPNLGNLEVEGLWGKGSKAFRDAYEAKAGRVFWKDGNRVSTGFADLLPVGESPGMYTIEGSANTASQFADKTSDALKDNHAKTVKKNLERLSASLKKSRDLARMQKSTYVDDVLRQLDECCTQIKDYTDEADAALGEIIVINGQQKVKITDYNRLAAAIGDPSMHNTINGVVKRAKMDSELLKKFAASTHPRDLTILKEMIEEGSGNWARVKNAFAEANSYIPWGPLIKGFLVYVSFLQVKDISQNLGAGEQERVLQGLLVDAGFAASLPAGLLALIVTSILEDAKDAGYSFVTRFQDCEDLIAGIYEVKGREQVSENQKIETNIDRLAKEYTEPDKLDAIIALHARTAASRGVDGEVTQKVDTKVEEKLIERCTPKIREKWQFRRAELIADAVGILSQLDERINSVDLIGVVDPSQLTLKDGSASTTAMVQFSSNGTTEAKLIDDYLKALRLLGGREKLVAVSAEITYRWTQDEKPLSESEESFLASKPIFNKSASTKRLTFAAAGQRRAKLEYTLEIDLSTIADDVLSVKDELVRSYKKSATFFVDVKANTATAANTAATAANTAPTAATAANTPANAATTATPTTTPTPRTSSTEDVPLIVGRTLPGNWKDLTAANRKSDNFLKRSSFNFEREPFRKTYVVETPDTDIEWERRKGDVVVCASVRASVSGYTSDIKNLDKFAAASGGTRDINISGFKGKFTDSTNEGKGWVVAGNRIISFGYLVSVSSVCGDVSGQTNAALAEAKAIVNSLTFTVETVKLIVSGGTRKLKKGDVVNVQAVVENPGAAKQPLQFNWTGDHAGSGANVTFLANKPGKQKLSVDVPSVGSASVEFEVGDLTAELKLVSPAAAKVKVGAPVTFSANLMSEGTAVSGNYIYRFEASPAVKFDTNESAGKRTNAVFSKPGLVKVWVEVLERKGEILEPVAPSNQIEIEVGFPELRIIFDQPQPLIGKPVKARVEVDPAELKNIDFRWELPANAKQTLQSQDVREVTFIPQNTNPITVKVNARVPFSGEDLGAKEATLRAQQYNVTVKVLGAEGPKPQIWREGVGLVLVENAIAVHQFVGMRAEVSPLPENARFEWILNDDSHFAGNNITQQIRVSRSQTGSCEATVVIRDKDGLELGRGIGTFNVSISQNELEKAKTSSGSADKLNEAKKIAKEGQLDQAITIVDGVLKTNPTNTEAADLSQKLKREQATITTQLTKVRTLIDQQRFPEASNELMVAKRLQNVYPPVLELEKELNEKRSKHESEKGAQLKQTIKKGDEYYEARKYAEAFKEYDKALQIDPLNVEAFFSRGITKRELKDFAGAIEDFNRALQIDPSNVETIRFRGITKRELKDLAGAIEDFNRALQIDPSNVETIRSRGNTKFAMKDYAGAISDNTKIIELKPNDWRAWSSRAFAKTWIDDNQGAIADFERSLALNPKNEDAKKALARLNGEAKAEDAQKLLKLGTEELGKENYAEALSAFNRALQIDPSNVYALVGRGRAKRELKDYTGSIEDYNRALQIDPSNIAIIRSREYTKIAMKDYAGVISDTTKIIELKPDDWEAWSDRAWAKTWITDNQGAIADYERSLALNPDNETAKKALARLKETIASDSNNSTSTEANAVIISNPQKGQMMTNSLGMKFMGVPAGSFMMGSPTTETGRGDNENLHEVQLTKGFWMQKYEVTQGEWEAVMGNNPSQFKGCPRCPVERISWLDVQEYITKLNERGEGTYRLPTEAEWEYAARGETATRYYWGNDESLAGEYAWYSKNSGGKTHEVGLKRPNNYGLFDMSGNVFEWVSDRFWVYPNGTVTDPVGHSSSPTRISRGGAWSYDHGGAFLRSAFRNAGGADARTDYQGFRLVLNPENHSDEANPEPDEPADIFSAGVVNSKATDLVKPTYPPAARVVGASGTVNVELVIDEEGNVISAEAVSGHALLRGAAEEAARLSKFQPTLLSGKKTKIRGVVVYNFSAQ